MNKKILFAAILAMGCLAQMMGQTIPFPSWTVGQKASLAQLQTITPSCADSLQRKLAVVGPTNDLYKYNCSSNQWELVGGLEREVFLANAAPSAAPSAGQKMYIDTLATPNRVWFNDNGAWRPFETVESEISLANAAPAIAPSAGQKMHIDTLSTPNRVWISDNGAWRPYEAKEVHNYSSAADCASGAAPTVTPNAIFGPFLAHNRYCNEFWRWDENDTQWERDPDYECRLVVKQSGLVVNSRVRRNGAIFSPVTSDTIVDFFFVNRNIIDTTFELLKKGCSGATALADGAYYVANGTGVVSTTASCRLVGSAFNGVFTYAPETLCTVGGGASGAAGGDLAGTLPNPTVDGLQGRAVANTAPTAGQVLAWNNTASAWEPTTPAAVTVGGDLDGTLPNPTVDGLQGRALANTAPTAGQVLTWNNGASRWEPATPAAGTVSVNPRLSGDGTPGNPLDIAARASATGVLVDFQTRKTFGTETAPVSGNVTFNTASAFIDEQYMWHQSPTAPTFPPTAVIEGAYQVSTLNLITLKYISATRIGVGINTH